MSAYLPTRHCLRACLLIPALLLSQISSAQVYQLEENTWDNPRFVQRFMGTLTFDQTINPQINADEQTLFKAVAELAKANQLNQAIAQLERSVTPESSAAVDYTLASFSLQAGDLDKSIRWYRQALEKFPNFYRAHQNLGLALVQKGSYSDALPHLVQAIEIGGGTGTLYGLLGFSYLNLERPTQALEAYRQALLLQPESRDWRLGKLNALLAIGESTEAIAMLEEMLEANPEKADYWLMQANALLSEKSAEKAAANLEIVRRMGQATGPSLALLGDLYVNMDLPAQAATIYEQAAREADLKPARLIRMARALISRNSYDPASDLIVTIQEKGGLSPDEEIELLNLQANIALNQGKTDTAAGILETIVARDPLNGGALISLGRYYQEKGQDEKAIFQFEAAAKVKESAVEALIAHARLLVQQRAYAEAVRLLRQAQAQEPRDYVADYIRKLELAIEG